MFGSQLGGFACAAVTLALSMLGTGGCVARALFTDGTSVSLGRADRGILRGARMLPPSGAGYVVPPSWVARGNLYGTDEIVGAVERAAARVGRELPGGILGVGDLSRRGGGDMSFHKSHENGRDADLIFYAVDETGAPLPPADAMPRFGRRLRAFHPYDAPATPVSPRWFDVARNWALVRALLEDGDVDVEYLFISERLRDKLLEHARGIHEPDALVKRAALALRQPARALPHDDHLHLRIRCAGGDRFQGCVDEGKVRLRSEVYRGPEPMVRRKQRVSRIATPLRRASAT